MNTSPSAIVIGAGIVGLATARSLAIRGYAVTVFERNQKAVGASIRNFGMIWPVGQPNGPLYERAMRSRHTWKEVCQEANLWYEEAGSMHLAYNALEAAVMQEVAAANEGIRNMRWINAAETLQKSAAVNPNELKGALWSGDDMLVEARVAIRQLPLLLAEKYKVQFHFQKAITRVESNRVWSEKEQYEADLIFVCSGADFESLYPAQFAAHNFTKCKLQMMRLAVQQDNWRIGPALCGGLSLIHYKAFQVAPSLTALQQHFEATMPEYLRWGIHVMVSQNAAGELTIGDSHEYGLVHDPFNKAFINQLILDYMKRIALFKNWSLSQSWNGIYAKQTNGATDFVKEADNAVWIVNGLGGAGMTLSFGLAEEVVSQLHS
jgi:FAD dependent oxidoreductase TIGR03364